MLKKPSPLNKEKFGARLSSNFHNYSMEKSSKFKIESLCGEHTSSISDSLNTDKEFHKSSSFITEEGGSSCNSNSCDSSLEESEEEKSKDDPVIDLLDNSPSPNKKEVNFLEVD